MATTLGLGCLSGLAALAAESPPANTWFDPDILRQRGLGPDIGIYFARAPHFQPGEQLVEVRVNGMDRGKRLLLFDGNGNSCISADFLQWAGIDLQPDKESTGEPCQDRQLLAQGFQTALSPTLAAVEISGPAQRVRSRRAVPPLVRGGVGGFVNYRAYALERSGPGQPHGSSRYLDTRLGANVDEWLFRSRLAHSAVDGQNRSQWQGAYLQKTFPEVAGTLQLGRIASAVPLYAGIQLTGFQWFPERGLLSRKSPAIEGVAIGRSRVELRQRGLLLHTTYVPGGPFVLDDYPQPDSRSDLEMKVVDASGIERLAVVPASSLMLHGDPAAVEGYSLALGRLWTPPEVRLVEQRAVAIASYGLQLRPELDLEAGALWAAGFQSSALAVRWRANDTAHVFGQLSVSHDGRAGVQGEQLAMGASFMLADWLDAGISAQRRSAAFRVVQQAQQVQQAAAPVDAVAYGDAVRSQASLQFSISGGWASGLALSFTHEDYFTAGPRRFYSVAWGGRWGPASLQAGLSRSATRVVDYGAALAPGTGRRAGTSAYVTLSVALGPGMVAEAYRRDTAGSLQQGTAFGQAVNDNFGYRVSVDRISDRAGPVETSRSLTASLLPRYTALTLAVTQGEHAQSRYGEMRGSLVATAAGVAASSFDTQDSYGLIRLGDVAGLRVDTPSGPVWSGPGGLAAAPSLLAFSDSRLEIAARSVPPGVDIGRGLIVTRLARGAVLDFDMDVRRVRRLLLTVTDAQGRTPAGRPAVFDGDRFVTTLDQHGRALLVVNEPPQRFRLAGSPLTDCSWQAMKLQPRRPGDFFEEATAVCHNLTGETDGRP